jgi:hypothetical protein
MAGPEYHGQTHRFGGSDYRGPNPISIKLFADDEYVTAGDGRWIIAVDEDVAKFHLVAVRCYVTTVSSSGAITVQVRNVTAAADMLSTAVTIDASEKNSSTAATAAVVDAANDLVSDGDEIAVDIDGAGTGAKGLGITLRFG